MKSLTLAPVAVLAVTLLITPAAAPTAVSVRAASSFVIVGNTSIGGFRPYRMNGRLSQAIAMFGEPTTIRRRTIDTIHACVAGWPELGLSMSFFPYARTCVPERSCFYEAIATGRRWRTAKGLRIGDTRRSLYQLYPKAKARGQWRALLIRPGLEGTYSALSAKLIRIRVGAFRVEAASCEAFFP
jgi:hypothetical protein